MSRNIHYLWVEGNIGAGKSTLINRITPILSRLFSLSSSTCVFVAVPEPLEMWINAHNSGENVLAAFYTDKSRNSYLFQSHVLITRISAITKAISDAITLNPKCRDIYLLCERSIYSDRYVFARSLFTKGEMSRMEMQVYQGLWDQMQNILPRGTTVAVVFLAAGRLECQTQMKRRGRVEESAVPADWLDRIGGFHELALREWKWPGSSKRLMCLSPEDLRDLPADDIITQVVAEKIFCFIRNKL